MVKKWLVGCSVEKTFEAESANLAVRYFLDWLSTSEGEHCITAFDKENSNCGCPACMAKRHRTKSRTPP